ncbi:uncharacterized protein LOC142355296, partial [Convolutriloba macropyga]|uniref:uncharacterized protein LOC142355296 n=1 Tax=Convolutriloba macropyga TaxID=536237 RepID=UPI003F52809E
PEEKKKDDKCPGPYEELNHAGEYLKTVCACHVLAFCWTIPSIILFGIALCCTRCRKENLGYMIGLLVCLGIQIIFALVAACIIADKEDIDVEGNQQWKYMVILLINAVLLMAACVAFAAVAVACRRKDDLSC